MFFYGEKLTRDLIYAFLMNKNYLESIIINESLSEIG
jgi:hypothetical protein